MLPAGRQVFSWATQPLDGKNNKYLLKRC